MEEAAEKVMEAMLETLPIMLAVGLILSIVAVFLGSKGKGGEEEGEREVEEGEVRNPELEDEIELIKNTQKKKLRFRFRS